MCEIVLVMLFQTIYLEFCTVLHVKASRPGYKKPLCLYEAWGRNVSFLLEISRCFSNFWPIAWLSQEVNTNLTCKGKALLVQNKVHWPAVVNVVLTLRVHKGRWILSSWTAISASLRTHLRGSSWVIVKLLLLCTVPHGTETSVLTRKRRKEVKVCRNRCVQKCGVGYVR